MTPAQQKEVEDAKEKWNREGAPVDSQAMYRKWNLKRVLEEFTEQSQEKFQSDVECCYYIDAMEWSSEGFDKFAEWSKLQFYPDDTDEESDEDKDDDTKAILPELVLDKKGYPKLPSHAGINTKGQQELVRQIFHASYTFVGLTVGRAEVFTKSAKPVPWHEVVTNQRLYLDLDCLPKDFLLRDPSHLRASDINNLWAHWDTRRATKQKLVIFVAGKLGDMSRARLENAVPHKEKKIQKEYMEIDDEDEEQTSAMPHPHPTAHTELPARIQPASNVLASMRPIPRTTGPAESDSSDNNSATPPSTGCTKGLAAQPSCAQAGAPAAVPMRDHVSFLKSLSSHDRYLLLVEGIRDLCKEQGSEEQKDWPTWAMWSWEGSHLPSAIHSEDGMVQVFLEMAASANITGLPSGMWVALGLGLLLRECKRAIEYEEDEATPNTPTYIGISILDIKILNLVGEVVNTVRGRVMCVLKAREGQCEISCNSTAEAPDDAHTHADGEERIVEDETSKEEERRRQEEEMKQPVEKPRSEEVELKQQLEGELQKLAEQKQLNEELKESMHKLQEETQMLQNANEALEQQMVEEKEMADEDGKDIPDVGSNDDGDEVQEEVREEVKGKKRSKSSGSGRVSKMAKTDICRSSRVRLPSKKAKNN
ncbi:uncharacterized protein BJ212DRAFT_1294756 [Suillus subaureus]|uniref:Uncharacterized protein n=1 Tax=Suillus subaureus TaxID=48587 RepID=A0A9P7JKE8_9AGAM|nr:uncharacterized protein BJ212DRAFT_1294756 [Suillus subaureus]KAG1827501.1 hypothetical protein BJ212DRAFT_1294756 [Suillus subaureus]